MTDNSDRLHKVLISCAAAHKKCSMQEFQKLNLSTGQPKVLAILSQKEGFLQKELALRCHVEPATMTSILNNMSGKGLIYRHQELVSGGKRAYSIHLTEKGRALAEEVNQIVEDVEVISFRNFSDDEKQLLIRLLTRVQTNLDKMPS